MKSPGSQDKLYILSRRRRLKRGDQLTWQQKPIAASESRAGGGRRLLQIAASATTRLTAPDKAPDTKYVHLYYIFYTISLQFYFF